MKIFAEHSEKHEQKEYSFILFIISGGDNSIRASENLKRLCESWLQGHYNIKVVDVIQDFQTALDYNILLTPSVIVEEPKPRITLHGDLSDEQKFIDALNLAKRRKNE